MQSLPDERNQMEFRFFLITKIFVSKYFFLLRIASFRIYIVYL